MKLNKPQLVYPYVHILDDLNSMSSKSLSSGSVVEERTGINDNEVHEAYNDHASHRSIHRSAVFGMRPFNYYFHKASKRDDRESGVYGTLFSLSFSFLARSHFTRVTGGGKWQESTIASENRLKISNYVNVNI